MKSKNKTSNGPPLEYREWAIRILSGVSLEEKLLSPAHLCDHNPGSTMFWKEPSRPPSMSFQKHSRENKLPAFHEHHKSENIAVCLHRFAGHELLAVEIMAFALLAFPNAPKSFRKGLANTLKEEQGHVKLYMKRLSELGVTFGDLPLYRHFWAHTPHLKSPRDYVSVMSLTFEQANLDFAPHYGLSFAKHGDSASAALMNQIFLDEIRHVSFGISWLKNFSKGKDVHLWDQWMQGQSPTLHPKRAKGFRFLEEPRKKAGIPEDWITKMKSL